MNLPMRSTAAMRRPGTVSPSATGSSMKSVLPRRTADDAAAGQDAPQSAHHGFDFGKFRHGEFRSPA